MRRQALTGFLLFLVFAAAPGERAGAVEPASIQGALARDGSGQMVANSQTNPETETWAWEACKPDLSLCAPFASGRFVSTRGAEPGTVFRTTSSLGASALSPMWLGRTASAGPPSVRGPIRANELVTPVPGKWKGGWAGSEDITQLGVCEGPRGGNCESITHTNYAYSCPDGAAVLDPKFVGWYLRVADRRLGPNSGRLDYGTGPYGHPLWKRERLVSAAVIGRIEPANGPRTEECGQEPAPGA